jgi:hypothetical protein
MPAFSLSDFAMPGYLPPARLGLPRMTPARSASPLDIINLPRGDHGKTADADSLQTTACVRGQMQEMESLLITGEPYAVALQQSR